MCEVRDQPVDSGRLLGKALFKGIPKLNSRFHRGEIAFSFRHKRVAMDSRRCEKIKHDLKRRFPSPFGS
jgi:hypothetical protein